MFAKIVVAVAFVATRFVMVALSAKKFVVVLYIKFELVPAKLPMNAFVAVALVTKRLVVEALSATTVPVAVIPPNVALYE